MPTYEMVLVTKKLDKAVVKTILQRSAGYIFQCGGIIRKLENLGVMDFPYPMKSSTGPVRTGQYFLVEYDANSKISNLILDNLKRDADVLKHSNFIQHRTPGGAINPPKKPECTIYEDLLPPPYRPSVIKLQKEIERKKQKDDRKKFKFNTGLDYDPLPV